ncbi:DUF3149 domain-containing protein [Gayadomonas joobiniege]|nr:DUF3149 domain-containing protein [Gayadomonas joobiniege]
MSPLKMLLQDPIVLGALFGVFIVLGLCGFYTWLIFSKIKESSAK